MEACWEVVEAPLSYAFQATSEREAEVVIVLGMLHRSRLNHLRHFLTGRRVALPIVARQVQVALLGKATHVGERCNGKDRTHHHHHKIAPCGAGAEVEAVLWETPWKLFQRFEGAEQGVVVGLLWVRTEEVVAEDGSHGDFVVTGENDHRLWCLRQYLNHVRELSMHL